MHSLYIFLHIFKLTLVWLHPRNNKEVAFAWTTQDLLQTNNFSEYIQLILFTILEASDSFLKPSSPLTSIISSYIMSIIIHSQPPSQGSIPLLMAPVLVPQGVPQ